MMGLRPLKTAPNGVSPSELINESVDLLENIFGGISGSNCQLIRGSEIVWPIMVIAANEAGLSAGFLDLGSESGVSDAKHQRVSVDSSPRQVLFLDVFLPALKTNTNRCGNPGMLGNKRGNPSAEEANN